MGARDCPSWVIRWQELSQDGPSTSTPLDMGDVLTISAAIAHPTETIKCKLQLQLVQPDHLSRQFAGPVDVVRQTINGQGITGMWKGVGASFIYRSCFAAMFGGTALPCPTSTTNRANEQVSRFSTGCLRNGMEQAGRCRPVWEISWLEGWHRICTG